MRLVLAAALGVSGVFAAAGAVWAEPAEDAALAMKANVQSLLPRAVLMAPIPDSGVSNDIAEVAAPIEALGNAKNCLAKAVYFEARGESMRGQEAVAEVVMTRSHLRGKSVCGVVYEGSWRSTGCQFSFTCDGTSDVVRNRAAWRKAKRVAGLVLSGRAPNVTHGATHYHASYVTPYWASSMTKVKTIGSHVFYRE